MFSVDLQQKKTMFRNRRGGISSSNRWYSNTHTRRPMSLKLLSQFMLKVQGHHRFNMNTLRMKHTHTPERCVCANTQTACAV